MGFTRSPTNITDNTKMSSTIAIGENPFNAVITLTDVWRCGTYLYKAAEGNCKVVLNISVDQDIRFTMTMEGKSLIKISLNPECNEFTKLNTLFETIGGQPGQMWKYEYGEDKSFTFDTVLSRELASMLNTYRLAF